MFNRFGLLLLAASLSFAPMGWSQEPPPEPVVRASLPGLASDQFPTLLAAVEAADLMEVLKAGGFTIFAPSDEAFHKLDPSRVREWLDPENKRDLKALVAYHIVAGELTASRILKALSRGKGTTRFTTVQGEELIATLEGSDIYLTDCSGNRARIVCADNINTRLVFHEIDTVVLPRPL